MKTLISKVFKLQFVKFGLVGVINTLVGTLIMFGLYNIFHVSYFWSSFANYFLGSILSYVLNKNYTFAYKGNDKLMIVRFAINIAVCYGLAYGFAKPVIGYIMSGASVTIQENVAMLLGMCAFVVLNYFGQKMFVFKDKKKEIDVLKNTNID